MVPLACRSEGDYRELATALQRGAPAFEARLSDAERIRGATDQRSAWQSNGPGRCGTWAFAPRPVAPPASREANAANRGRRLKLAVVRRNWAGQGFRHDRQRLRANKKAPGWGLAATLVLIFVIG